MNTVYKKRPQVLEETQTNESTFFAVIGYSDIDKLDRRALHPKSKILIIAIENGKESEQIKQAISCKFEALRRGNNEALFVDHPKTELQEWAT